MNPLYSEAKQQKRKEQLRAYEAVLSLPVRAQGSALYALWPQKLPKVVRRAIQAPLRKMWLHARGEKMRLFHEAFVHALEHVQQDHELLEALEDQDDMEAFEQMLLTQHGQAIDDLSAIVFSLPHLKDVTMVCDEAFRVFEFEEDSVLKGGRNEAHQFKMALGIALDEGGGITVRQKLPLLSQVENEQGEMEWKNQERVFGFACFEGQWAGLTASDMRQAHNTDHTTGKVVPHDPVTSIGDAHNLVRDYFEKMKGVKG